MKHLGNGIPVILCYKLYGSYLPLFPQLLSQYAGLRYSGRRQARSYQLQVMADEVSWYKEQCLSFEISALYLSWRDHSCWPGLAHLMNGSAARIRMSKWIRCTSHPSNHNENLYEIGFMHWDDLRICSWFFTYYNLVTKWQHEDKPAPTIPESWESTSYMGGATISSYLILN